MADSRDMSQVELWRRTCHALAAALRYHEMPDEDRDELARMHEHASASLHAELRRMREDRR